MIRLFIGFVFGIFIAFYSLPSIENTFGDLPRPYLSKLVSEKDITHTSNIINSMPLTEIKELQDTELGKTILSMAYNLKDGEWTHPAPEKVVNMLKNIAANEPQIRQQVQNKLSDGMTNIEVFEIANSYFSNKEG